MVPPTSTPKSAARTTPLEFSNVRILASDFAAVWTFYHDLLGLTAGVGDASGPYAEFLWKGDARIGVFDAKLMGQAVGLTGSRPNSPTDVGRFAVIFEVEDVDEWHRELLARGVPILQPPTDRPDWSLRTLHLRDPEGNVVEFYSRPK